MQQYYYEALLDSLNVELEKERNPVREKAILSAIKDLKNENKIHYR